jgi:hypothetical protein
MQRKIRGHGHEPRLIDLLAVLVLILASLGAFVYVTSTATSKAPSATAFIVPSQTVRW